MIKHRPLAILLFAGGFSTAVAQAPFTLGNLVVVSVSTASGVTSNLWLDEYTPAGVFVQSLPLPAATSGLQRQISIRGTAASEGFLNVSTNGLYLLLAGYDAPAGTASTAIEASTAASINRVVARVGIDGSVDTSTALTDAFDGSTTFQGNVRAVASDDGARFWVSGTGQGSSGGIRHVTALGDSTSAFLNLGAPTNCRVCGIYDGLLYTTSASTVYLGVCSVGSGLPTQPGQGITLLPGFPTAGGTAAGSAYDFFWADANTVYVADDNAPASTVGGISKWTFDGISWSRAYRLTVTPTATSNWGARGLTGFVRDGVATLWATMNTGSGTGTVLCSVVDTGPTATVTQLLPSPTGTAFRGIRYLAKPSTITRLTAGCGTVTAKVAGNAEIGTDVRTTVGDFTVLPIVIYGVTALGLPIDPGCACLLGQTVDIVQVGAVSTLSIPNVAALAGTVIYTQGADLFAAGACTSPLAVALTDSFAIPIQ